MSTLAEVIVDLVERLPTEVDARERAGLAIVVDTLDVRMPIEARITTEAELWASPPRGRIVTGFMAPVVTLTARFAVASPEEG